VRCHCVKIEEVLAVLRVYGCNDTILLYIKVLYNRKIILVLKRHWKQCNTAMLVFKGL